MPETLWRPSHVRRHRALRLYRAPVGEGQHAVVIVLPGHDVPLEHLVPTNWRARDAQRNVGYSRPVHRVRRLTNGETVHLFIKEPIRDFTIDTERLVRGEPWFQHPEPWVSLRGNRTVERGAAMEARVLRRLHQEGLPVEQPLALICRPGGVRQLVTHGITPTRRETLGTRVHHALYAFALPLRAQIPDGLRTALGRVRVGARAWVTGRTDDIQPLLDRAEQLAGRHGFSTTGLAANVLMTPTGPFLIDAGHALPRKHLVRLAAEVLRTLGANRDFRVPTGDG
jgi:hypothetical protein